MIKEEKDFDVYLNATSEMHKSITLIFVEGQTIDKIFYSNLSIFKKHIIVPRGPCDKVQQSVVETHNSIGVIDGDYTDNVKDDRIFKINYYSIENIVLIKNPDFRDLRELLKRHTRFMAFNKIKYHCCDFKYEYVPYAKKYHGSLLVSNDTHHQQYFKFIRKAITSRNKFYKRKDLKKVVLHFADMTRQINREKDKAWHIKTLDYDSVESITFKSHIYKKISKILAT